MTLESSVATKRHGSLCLYASSAWPQSTVQWLQGMIQVKFAELRLLVLARASKAANQALVTPGGAPSSPIFEYPLCIKMNLTRGKPFSYRGAGIVGRR